MSKPIGEMTDLEISREMLALERESLEIERESLFLDGKIERLRKATVIVESLTLLVLGLIAGLMLR